jgi:hypothetical protein
MAASPVKETYPACRVFIKDGYDAATGISDGYDIIFATNDSSTVKTSGAGKPTTDGFYWTYSTGINVLARAFSQGTPGNIVVTVADGSDKIIPGSLYPSGYIFMIQVSAVKDIGTTAKGLVFYI